MSAVRIGFSTKSITPDQPVLLAGQFYRRVSESVESPILAAAMAVESGGEQMVLCSCDLVSIHPSLMEAVRKKVADRNPDLRGESIIACATHTHTAPEYRTSNVKNSGLLVAARFLPEGKRLAEDPIPEGIMPPEAYADFASTRISEAIVEAWERRAPSFFSPAFGRAVTGHCRRVTYDDGSARMYGNTALVNFESVEGPNDTGVEMLYVFDEARAPTGVVVNVACPSQVVMHHRFISSDYWGKARDFIRERFGPDFTVIPLCGAAGDQCPEDLVRWPKRIEPGIMNRVIEGAVELGRRVARVVEEQFESARGSMSDEAVLQHRRAWLDFPLRKVTLKDYAEAKAAFDACVAAMNKEVFDYKDMRVLHLQAGIMNRFDVQQQTHVSTAEIHVARFANLAFASNPFELFLDFGSKIRALSKADQTFLIQQACSALGYLPTEKAERGGHYSAYVSSGRTGHEGGDLLVRKTLQMLDALWEESRVVNTKEND